MPDSGGPEHPTIIDAMSHVERARLLLELCQCPEYERDLEEISTVLANRQDTDPTIESREHIELRLYHTHLPKLEQAGLIDYDWDEGKISYTGDPAPETLRELISDLGLSPETEE